MTTAPTMPMVLVHDGRKCIGFVIARGRLGFEAFSADQRSLGILPNQKRAADAITGTRTCTQSS
jgi:hypothetical protein